MTSMTNAAQPFSVLAARLQAQKPWLSWSQICSELGKRGAECRRARKIRTVRKPEAAGRQWWQE